MSELQTLALDILHQLRRDFDQKMEAIQQKQANHADSIKTLEARQAESELLLERLSELYKCLLPLIETINSGIRNEPRK